MVQCTKIWGRPTHRKAINPETTHPAAAAATADDDSSSNVAFVSCIEPQRYLQCLTVDLSVKTGT